MDYADYIAGISFRFLNARAPIRGDIAKFLQLLERRGISFEIKNTKLPRRDRYMKHTLRDICRVPKESTFAIGALINKGVSEMRHGDAFVNIGVLHGFTFLCGVVNNHHRNCVGVDDYSRRNSRSVRDGFLRRFEKYRSPNHHFHEMDFKEYLSQVHRGSIGFYVYDADHSYEGQLSGLQLAEPFFSRGCIILVDDANSEAPRQATMGFISLSSQRYRILLDRTTYGNRHPTFWNGLIVLQKS